VYDLRSLKVELACADTGKKGVPFGWREVMWGETTILGVAECDSTVG
jgi:hypothetical protein